MKWELVEIPDECKVLSGCDCDNCPKNSECYGG